MNEEHTPMDDQYVRLLRSRMNETPQIRIILENRTDQQELFKDWVDDEDEGENE